MTSLPTGATRLVLGLVLLLGVALASANAQGVNTDSGCGSFLGSDVACGDGSRNPRNTTPGAAQPAPPMQTSGKSWGESDFDTPASIFAKASTPRGMNPTMQGVSATQGLPRMTAVQTQANGGTGMTGWLAVLAVFVSAAALVSGS